MRSLYSSILMNIYPTKLIAIQNEFRAYNVWGGKKIWTEAQIISCLLEKKNLF